MSTALQPHVTRTVAIEKICIRVVDTDMKLRSYSFLLQPHGIAILRVDTDSICRGLYAGGWLKVALSGEAGPSQSVQLTINDAHFIDGKNVLEVVVAGPIAPSSVEALAAHVFLLLQTKSTRELVLGPVKPA